MKPTFIIFVFLLFVRLSYGQTFNYYFIEIRPTGKAEVEVSPEAGVVYSDIDHLIVSKADTTKKGVRVVTGRKYASYSEVFKTFSASGLEFVQFVTLEAVGGAAGKLVGSLPTNYVLWRKRLD